MVRKQLYISAAQDRKLKQLAGQRGVTEAELVRQAIERLPEADSPLTAQLRSKGLIAPKPPLPEDMQGQDLDALAEQLREELGDLGGVALSDAVLWEREHSPY